MPVELPAQLPALYARWLTELLGAPPAGEPRSSCDSCPQCASGGRNLSDHVFSADTKCCTYWPTIPNFLAGAILDDLDPEVSAGRQLFADRVGARRPDVAVLTPLGVYPPPGWMARYHAEAGKFGRLRELLCPYYLADGRCGIWRYRNGRCASWFCRYQRGSPGVIFWKYADQLFTVAERALARWCLLQLDLPPDCLQRTFPPPQSDVDLGEAEQLWGPWWGREAELYRACARRVETLSWDDVIAIGGVELVLAARLLSDAARGLADTSLPLSLRPGAVKEARQVAPDVVRVWTYNVYDPLDLTAEQHALLVDGGERPSEEWGKALGRLSSPEQAAGELRQWVDRGILVASAP